MHNKSLEEKAEGLEGTSKQKKETSVNSESRRQRNKQNHGPKGSVESCQELLRRDDMYMDKPQK